MKPIHRLYAQYSVMGLILVLWQFEWISFAATSGVLCGLAIGAFLHICGEK